MMAVILVSVRVTGVKETEIDILLLDRCMTSWRMEGIYYLFVKVFHPPDVSHMDFILEMYELIGVTLSMV